VADYGVNIAVAVKNTEAITALTRKIKLTTSQVGQLNNFLVNFNDWRLGPAVVNSVDNFSKALKDARDNLNSAALGSKEAADAARDFARAQDLANDALREQAELLAQVRNEGRSGTLRGGTQYSGPAGPGFSGLVSRQASATALSSPLPPSVPVALRSPMRPQSLLPQMGMTAQAGKIASDMEDVYASILRLTEKANQEEAEKLQTLRQGTKEVEELAQKYRVVNETRKTEKQLQLEMRRSILETKQAAAEEARIANQGLLDRLRNLEAIGAERREQFIQFNKEENEKRQIRMRELDFEERLAKVQARNRDRAERGRRATSSALIGGAFPLLFGQGLGAAAGGAAGGFGGGMIGGEFGFGVSLIGTQIGSMIDQLGQKAIDLGRALDPLTADTEAVIDAVGKADTEFALLVEELEAAGRTAEALQLVTDELEKVVGEDGVEAIELFSAGIRGLQNDFTVFITQVAAVVAQAINDLTGQTRQIQEIREVGKTIQEARKSDDPRIKAAIAELDAIPEFQVDKKTQEKRVSTRKKIAELVTRIAAEELKASRDAIARVATEEKRLTTLVQSDKVARETRYLLAAQIQLEEAGSNLLDEKVVAARKRVIQEEYLAAYRQAEGSEQGQLLAGDQRRLALLELDNDIAAAQTKETERLAREAQKTTKERNTQITQALTLEQKFAAELKQREATTELEADKARIAAEFEDRMRRIEKIGDDTLTAEAQRLANQIKITDEAQAEANARLRSLQAANALKDSQAGFQMQLETLRANAPGAFSGPFAGSERAGFLGGLEMQFELERRNREIETMQGRVSAGKADQEDVDNLVALRDQYKLYQTQILEATVAQQKFADALALTQPVTDSLFDSLIAVADGTKSAEEAFADFLRSIASMLVDAAKQMIAQYIAIGIARMFAGIPASGSSNPFPGHPTHDKVPIPALPPLPGVEPKALGGAVGAGRPYMVGERGPELFIPGAQGNIVPNNAMGSANVVVNVDASGSSVEGDADQASQLGKVIGIAVQQELVKQKRPGGLLAS
jgi:hypothetical protein